MNYDPRFLRLNMLALEMALIHGGWELRLRGGGQYLHYEYSSPAVSTVPRSVCCRFYCLILQNPSKCNKLSDLIANLSFHKLKISELMSVCCRFYCLLHNPSKCNKVEWLDSKYFFHKLKFHLVNFSTCECLLQILLPNSQSIQMQ